MKGAARSKKNPDQPAGAAAGLSGAGGKGDRTFLAFVLDQLRGLRGVESRAMFGGHGLYQGLVFFAIIHRGRLYFRVSDATRPEYEARGMSPFMPGARQTLKRYYEAPAEVLEDAAEAVRWARAAVAAGSQAKARGTR